MSKKPRKNRKAVREEIPPEVRRGILAVALAYTAARPIIGYGVGFLLGVSALYAAWPNVTAVYDHVGWATPKYARDNEMTRKLTTLISQHSYRLTLLDYDRFQVLLAKAVAKLKINPDDQDAEHDRQIYQKIVTQLGDQIDKSRLPPSGIQ